ncbi:MAG: lipoyl synthase [Clostridiales bacterium]|nr:lipoyl synthase [Clostridiales bacterium]
MHAAKPDWIVKRIPYGPDRKEIEETLRGLSLHTVCEQAGCPNLGECFCNKTATFMVLGNVCTRNCTFCQVSKGTPLPVDAQEPEHVAQAVKQLGLKHVVVTSVTRDDLPDGGAGHFTQVIEAVRQTCPQTNIEVLIPDFQGDPDALKTVIAAKPTVINHNVETIERLYPEVRPMADYRRSLELLRRVKDIAPEIRTKSGVMVGLGERYAEVIQVMRDLRAAGCEFLTIGQYLAPSKRHHPVVEYIHPDVFAQYHADAEKLGFSYTSSGPFVRSSYRAGEALRS